MPGESQHRPSGEDQRVLPAPVPGEALNVGMPGPPIDLDGQPLLDHSDIEPVFGPGHPVIDHPTRDAAPPEQPMQHPLSLRACPIRGLPQHPAQPG